MIHRGLFSLGLLGEIDVALEDSSVGLNLGFHLRDHGSLLLDQTHEALVLAHTMARDRSAHLGGGRDNGTLEDLVEVVDGLLRSDVSLDVSASGVGGSSGGDQTSVDGVENVSLSSDSLGESLDSGRNGVVSNGQSGELLDHLSNLGGRGRDDGRSGHSQTRKRSLDDTDLVDVSSGDDSLVVNLTGQLTDNVGQMSDLLLDGGSLGNREGDNLSSKDNQLVVNSLGLDNGLVDLVVSSNDALDHLRV